MYTQRRFDITELFGGASGHYSDCSKTVAALIPTRLSHRTYLSWDGNENISYADSSKLLGIPVAQQVLEVQMVMALESNWKMTSLKADLTLLVTTANHIIVNTLWHMLTPRHLLLNISFWIGRGDRASKIGSADGYTSQNQASRRIESYFYTKPG